MTNFDEASNRLAAGEVDRAFALALTDAKKAGAVGERQIPINDYARRIRFRLRAAVKTLQEYDEKLGGNGK